MTKNIAITIYRLLANIPLNKFDKETRVALLNNFDKLSDTASDFDKKLERYNKKLFEGKEAEQMEVAELREKYKAALAAKSAETEAIANDILSHVEYLDLEKDQNQFIEKLLAEKVDVTLDKISRESFVNGCADADYNITPMALKELAPLFN